MKGLACLIFTVFIGVCIHAASATWGFSEELLALYGIIFFIIRLMVEVKGGGE